MLLTVGLLYILYTYNQSLPPAGQPKVKASSSGLLPPPGHQKWPPKFGDQQRLPDMNGAVTEGANINGGADNEEHNAAVEEEQHEQEKQENGENDVDFDGGDSNKAVENKVEEAADKDKSAAAAGNLAVAVRDDRAEAVILPPKDGSLVFAGPQVQNTYLFNLKYLRFNTVPSRLVFRRFGTVRYLPLVTNERN